MFKWKFFGTTKQVKIMIDVLTLFEKINTQILKIQIIGLTDQNLSGQWYNYFSRVTSFQGLWKFGHPTGRILSTIDVADVCWRQMYWWQVLDVGDRLSCVDQLLVTNMLHRRWIIVFLRWHPIRTPTTVSSIADALSGKFLNIHLHFSAVAAAIATTWSSWVMIFGPNWVNSTSL